MVNKFLDKAQTAWRRRKFSPRQWAEHLRTNGNLYHLGEDCSILPSAKIVNPHYTWIGNRVCLGNCTLIAHDGAVEMLNQKFGLRLDRVGPIILHDDVFVGEQALVLGNTTIGEGSIIGAGSVVRQSVPPGSVVMGNPARVVAKTEDVARFWEAETLALPWAEIIAARQGAYDAALEPELIRRRQEYFFQGALRRRSGG